MNPESETSPTQDHNWQTAKLAVECAFQQDILQLSDELKAKKVRKWHPESAPLRQLISTLAQKIGVTNDESIDLCVGGLLH